MLAWSRPPDSDENVRHLLDDHLSDDLFDDRERAVVAYARELVRTANVSAETFAELAGISPTPRRWWRSTRRAALPNITNRVNNPFRTDLDAGVAPVPT